MASQKLRSTALLYAFAHLAYLVYGLIRKSIQRLGYRTFCLAIIKTVRWTFCESIRIRMTRKQRAGGFDES